MSTGAQWRLENRERFRATANASNRRRRRIIDQLKLAAGCMDCGWAQHPAALDFDHVRGEKKFGVAMFSARSWKVIHEEIAKCDVVCANCHCMRTVGRFNVAA